MLTNKVKIYDFLNHMQEEDIMFLYKMISKEIKNFTKEKNKDLETFFIYKIYILEYIYNYNCIARKKINILITDIFKNKCLCEKIHSIVKNIEYNNFFIYFFKNYNNKIFNKFNLYLKITKELNICDNLDTMLLFTYILNNYNYNYKIDYNYLSHEKKEAILFVNKTRAEEIDDILLQNNYAGWLFIIENYFKIKSTVIYNEEMLDNITSHKQKISYIYSQYNCFEQFDNMYNAKIREYCENNITKKDIDYANKYNFKCYNVGNTIFIKSLIDSWYMEVEKKPGRIKLFHSNDGQPGSYHIQKKYTHNCINNVFKDIDSHDKYSLYRYDNSIFNKLNYK